MIPAAFVLLWSTGFIGARLGLPYAEPLTFLSLRFALVVALLSLVCLVARAPWPRTPRAALHIAVAGLLVQAGYLGGVFSAIHLGLSAGAAALIVGALLAIAADLIAQAPGSRTVLPLNAVTALFGAPVVILAILRWRGLRASFG